MSSPRTILVVGATGKQGSAVVRHLAKASSSGQDWKIKAITRDSTSDKAKALASLHGVELLQGELDHPEPFFDNGPIYGVFFMHNPPNNVAQNKALCELSAKHGVKHYVHSGVDFCNDSNSGIDYIEGYQTAEKDVKKQSFMTTFVRPVGFMENFYWPLYVQCVSANWDEKLQYKTVAVDDIGRAVASIFADPKKFDGRVVNLAGASHTRDEIIALAKETIKQEWDFKGTPDIPPPMVKPFKYWDEHMFGADPKECEELFPGMTDLRTWFKNSHLPAGGMGASPVK